MGVVTAAQACGHREGLCGWPCACCALSPGLPLQMEVFDCITPRAGAAPLTPRTGRACALGWGGTQGLGGKASHTQPVLRATSPLIPVPLDHLPKATGAESAGLNPHHIPDGKARIAAAEVATRLFSGWWV